MKSLHVGWSNTQMLPPLFSLYPSPDLIFPIAPIHPIPALPLPFQQLISRIAFPQRQNHFLLGRLECCRLVHLRDMWVLAVLYLVFTLVFYSCGLGWGDLGAREGRKGRVGVLGRAGGV
ncbi:hypothetical protein CC86DRAFT_32619 [Ophiobolus disseminans]|uniref:Uncharacterized protein n=1 Tax=Ophiobolus disseminans TaxID=1469910 RepID=A0A6A6ZWX7_9PLEO|nr:hypothetical protein CC86DRAFT_32619 [Ophiobolus disseminans]